MFFHFFLHKIACFEIFWDFWRYFETFRDFLRYFEIFWDFLSFLKWSFLYLLFSTSRFFKIFWDFLRFFEIFWDFLRYFEIFYFFSMLFGSLYWPSCACPCHQFQHSLLYLLCSNSSNLTSLFWHGHSWLNALPWLNDNELFTSRLPPITQLFFPKDQCVDELSK